MKYKKKMQEFANWIAASPTRITEARLSDLINDFSWRLIDGKGHPITIKDMQIVRRTLVGSLLPVVQGRKRIAQIPNRSKTA